MGLRRFGALLALSDGLLRCDRVFTSARHHSGSRRRQEQKFEPLEPRCYMSLTPLISGTDEVQVGAPYELNLQSQGGTADSYTVNWGDGTSDTYSGDTTSATHTFASSVTSSDITATASDGTSAIPAYESLDPSFGGGGLTSSSFDPLTVNPSALAVESNGDILAVGTASDENSQTQLAMARYYPDGTRDDTFGQYGTTTVNLSGYGASPAYAIENNGKIIVAGGDQETTFMVTQYNDDGSPDVQFGSSGVASINSDDLFDATVFDVAVQPDGKILVAGGSDAHFALVRYFADGTVDTDFGSDGSGSVIEDAAGLFDRPTDAKLQLQSNGDIILAGTVDSTFQAFRFDGSGALLNSASLSSDDSSASFTQIGVVSLDSNGKLEIAGIATTALSGQQTAEFATARLNSDFSIDTTFNGDGQRLSAFGAAGSTLKVVALDATGNFIAAGADAYGSTLLARYGADGTLDSGFAANGNLATSMAGATPTAICLQSDGRILIGTTGFGIARFSGSQFITVASHVPTAYYVSATGSATSGNGTYSVPLNISSIPNLAVGAGDVVNIVNGSHPIQSPLSFGSKYANVTVTNYPSNQPAVMQMTILFHDPRGAHHRT